MPLEQSAQVVCTARAGCSVNRSDVRRLATDRSVAGGGRRRRVQGFGVCVAARIATHRSEHSQKRRIGHGKTMNQRWRTECERSFEHERVSRRRGRADGWRRALKGGLEWTLLSDCGQHDRVRSLSGLSVRSGNVLRPSCKLPLVPAQSSVRCASRCARSADPCTEGAGAMASLRGIDSARSRETCGQETRDSRHGPGRTGIPDGRTPCRRPDRDLAHVAVAPPGGDWLAGPRDTATKGRERPLRGTSPREPPPPGAARPIVDGRVSCDARRRPGDFERARASLDGKGSWGREVEGLEGNEVRVRVRVRAGVYGMRRLAWPGLSQVLAGCRCRSACAHGGLAAAAATSTGGCAAGRGELLREGERGPGGSEDGARLCQAGVRTTGRTRDAHACGERIRACVRACGI